MSKHTPGPWIWGRDYLGLFGAGPDNEVLDHAHYEGMWLGHNPYREANAALIAAAPDLLAALENILNNSGHATLEQLLAARNAVAKAKGEDHD